MCDCGENSCVSCNPILVERGPKGDTGNTGLQGSAGYNGWSESLVLVQNNGTTLGTGIRYCLMFNGWVGGTGSAPTTPTAPNIYLQANGTFGILSTAADLVGPAGNTMVWLGTFAAAPGSPALLNAYRDSVLMMARIWDGSTWQEMVEDGLAGTAGTPGTNGISITWKGNLAGPPASPQLNWAYRDTTTGPPIVSYIWNGASWDILCVDGTNGTNGTNGFNYETVDGNGIPATAIGNAYSFLIRRPDDTGYIFQYFGQVKGDLNVQTGFQQF